MGYVQPLYGPLPHLNPSAAAVLDCTTLFSYYSGSAPGKMGFKVSPKYNRICMFQNKIGSRRRGYTDSSFQGETPSRRASACCDASATLSLLLVTGLRGDRKRDSLMFH